MPEPRGGDVDEGELDRTRNYARAAREHPTWSVAYAQDVPRLLAELERLKTECRAAWELGSGALAAEFAMRHRLRFAEMVLDRNAAAFDGLPWREAARLREAADGIDEPETAPKDRSAADLLAEVAASGVEHDDERMDYVTVQIDRGLWELVQMQRADNA